MDLPKRTEFCQQLLYIFENLESWFDVKTNEIPIFVLFVRAGVLFDGAFSLWVSLT